MASVVLAPEAIRNRERFIMGPWSWMLIVYTYDPERDQVQVLTIEDARTATSATSSG